MSSGFISLFKTNLKSRMSLVTSICDIGMPPARSLPVFLSYVMKSGTFIGPPKPILMPPSLEIFGFIFGGGIFTNSFLLLIRASLVLSSYSLAYFKTASTSFWGAIIVPGGINGYISLNSFKSLYICYSSVSVLLIGGGGGSGAASFLGLVAVAAADIAAGVEPSSALFSL
jgi:hypothetical protein